MRPTFEDACIIIEMMEKRGIELTKEQKSHVVDILLSYPQTFGEITLYAKYNA